MQKMLIRVARGSIDEINAGLASIIVFPHSPMTPVMGERPGVDVPVRP